MTSTTTSPLFIALANSHYFLRGGEAGVLGGYPRDVGRSTRHWCGS